MPIQFPKDFAPYTMRGLKSHEGRDGLCWAAKLYRDKTYVADVVDEGNGGCCFFYWEHPDHEAAFDAHLLTLPPDPEDVPTDGERKISSMDRDMFVARLGDAIDNERRIKRLCKTKIVLELSTNTPGEFSTINQPYTPQLAVKVREKYGASLVRIINELFIPPMAA